MGVSWTSLIGPPDRVEPVDPCGCGGIKLAEAVIPYVQIGQSVEVYYRLGKRGQVIAVQVELAETSAITDA